jgi:hypothetical protein
VLLLNVTAHYALLLVEHALLLSNLVVLINTVNVTIVPFLWLPSNLFPLQISDASNFQKHTYSSPRRPGFHLKK